MPFSMDRDFSLYLVLHYLILTFLVVDGLGLPRKDGGQLRPRVEGVLAPRVEQVPVAGKRRQLLRSESIFY